MRKKLTVLVAMVMMLCVMLLSGCSESMVYSTLTIYDDLSGTKSVVVRVFGDEEDLEGRDYTAGNNTAFMLTQGEALAEKLDEFCALDDVEIDVRMGESKTVSTYITFTFDFTDISDYNSKAKILAGKYADQWVDAELIENGDGTVTVREAASNLPLLYLDILEKYFNDFDCYPVYEYGPDTQSQYIPNGIQFSGDDMYSFTWWIVPTATKVVVGETNSEDVYFDPAEDYEHREDLSGKVTEATGTPSARPTVTSVAVKENTKKDYFVGDKFGGGTLVVTWSDGTTNEVAITSKMIEGFDASAEGTKTVTVTYRGQSADYEITVSEESSEPVPTPDPGDDTPQSDEDGGKFPWWGTVLIIVGVITIVAGVAALLMRRKKK